MIVGFCTMTDTQFVQTSAREQGTQGQATAPVSLSLAAAGAVVPFAGLVDPSVQGGFASFAGNKTRIFAPGEQICTIKYREVKYDDENVITVDIKDVENLGDEWTAAESEEGFIYVRS
jgi:hypothetical protein